MTEDLLSGTILDDSEELSLVELARICSCRTELIVELVDEGVLEPAGKDTGDWMFTGTCLVKTYTAIRLHQDLDINIPGVALTLDLLEEIRELRARLDLLD